MRTNNTQLRDGLVTFPTKQASITNEDGEIAGADGYSGEGTSADPAEIAFQISTDVESGSTSVTAEQP